MTELLRLTAPEIVVALAGLLVLILDLGFLRRATLAIRFRAAVVLSCIGCAIGLGVLVRFPAQGALPAGMLVVNPLTQLVQIALVDTCDSCSSAGELCALHYPCGRILRADVVCHHRDDGAGEHAEPVDHLHHH